MIGAKTVPQGKAEAFRLILEKPHNFITGYLRQFWLDGDLHYVDTRYDDDLAELGLIEKRELKE